MINKTLSEQICEICGIEPIRSCTNSLYLCQVSCYSDCIFCNSKYPDFKNNNNNFVKLLEVLYKEIGLYDLFFTTDNNRKQLKSDILKTIVELLSNKLGYKIPLITKIKKIIRETDWEI